MAVIIYQKSSTIPSYPSSDLGLRITFLYIVSICKVTRDFDSTALTVLSNKYPSFNNGNIT